MDKLFWKIWRCFIRKKNNEKNDCQCILAVRVSLTNEMFSICPLTSKEYWSSIKDKSIFEMKRNYHFYLKNRQSVFFNEWITNECIEKIMDISYYSQMCYYFIFIINLCLLIQGLIWFLFNRICKDKNFCRIFRSILFTKWMF